MDNLGNVREVMGACPTLYFESHLDFNDPEAVSGGKGSVSERYVVDYENRSATVFSLIEQCGVKHTVTTVYENGSVHHYYHGLAQDDVTRPAPEEYEALFQVGGQLYPVNMDVLESKEMGTGAGNNVSEDSTKISCQVLDNKRVRFISGNEHCSLDLTVQLLGGR